MVTAAAPTAHAIATGLKALRRDFDVLGLAASEARIDVIRQAAVVQTQLVRSREMDADQHQIADEKIADIVYSTYRLLDPRRRRKLVERVHLSLMLDSVDVPDRSIAALPIPAPFTGTAGSHADGGTPAETLVDVELVHRCDDRADRVHSENCSALSAPYSYETTPRVDLVQPEEGDLIRSERSTSTLSSVVSQVQQWAEAIWSGFHYVIRPVVELDDVDDRANRPRQGGTRV